MISNIHRFHGRASLRFVYQRGQMVRGALVSLRFVRNDRQQVYRVAVVVSRKVSKSAVVRNRIRRRLYEIVRKNSQLINGPYDLVFTIYGEEAALMSHTTLQKIILDELKKAGVLHKTAISEAERVIVDEKENSA